MKPEMYIPLIFTGLAIPPAVAFFANKRIIKVHQVIIHLLSFVLAFCLLGAVGKFIDNSTQYLYLVLQVLFLALGILHVWLMHQFQSWSRHDYLLAELLFTLMITLIGGAGFLWVNQALSETPINWFIATAILPFLFPFFVYKTITLWRSIPSKIYHIWLYLDELGVPEIIPSEAIRVHLRMAKDLEQSNLSKFTVRAPMNMKFGDVFHYFLYDYNNEHPSGQIQANAKEYPFGWYFYTKSGWWKKKNPIDPNISVYRNQLKNDTLIIAKRIQLEH